MRANLLQTYLDKNSMEFCLSAVGFKSNTCQSFIQINNKLNSNHKQG